MRTTAFAAVDAVVILDVLHYVSIADHSDTSRSGQASRAAAGCGSG